MKPETRQQKPGTKGTGAERIGAEPPAKGTRMPLTLRWFLSKTVRHATSMRNHVRRILCAQRDLLSGSAVEAVQQGLTEMEGKLRLGAGRETLEAQMTKLEETANKWLKPYPHHAWRENVEVFLVALAVAMGIRTFFVQPFKIPTGSMQPTLFGVMSENLLAKPDFQIPTGWQRAKEWFEGISYIDIKAKTDGKIDRVTPPFGIRIFNFWQQIYIGGVAHPILFPPDYGQEPLERRASLSSAHHYRKGEQVVRLKVQSGDHLFVDRLTYNFRRPKRGEIIVFATQGIPDARRQNPPFWNIPEDQFYIKRLVGLGGESLRIGEDRHVYVNGKALDSSVRHFENVYSFDPEKPPANSAYSGHVTDQNMPFFPNGDATHRIADGALMVFGDNTVSSLDSRYWGEFPATSVIGKSFFVYWPITGRFGWGQD